MPELTKEQLNALHTIDTTFSFFTNDFQDYWNAGIPETIPFIYVTEAKENYNIEMVAPGLKKDDFNIEIGKNLITLSCETESFYRSFVIPDDADARGSSATYDNGVLSLLIPKKPEVQKNKLHKITVE